MGKSGWPFAESMKDFMKPSSVLGPRSSVHQKLRGPQPRSEDRGPRTPSQPPQVLQITNRFLKRARSERDRELSAHALQLVGRDAEVAEPHTAIIESERAW